MLPTVPTGSVRYLRPLSGSKDWFWGMDHTDGDLYEAEELYQLNHKIDRTRLILVRDEDRRVFEPAAPRAGQYFGVPIFHAGAPLILLADFPAGVVRVLRFDPASGDTTPVFELPRTAFADCYNLQLHVSPLILTRQTGDRFQILWPYTADFPIEPTESFDLAEGERLYFSRWHETPDYWEDAVVRDARTGVVLEVLSGALCLLPDGRSWLLTD